jgi:hypothetical protein
MRSLNDIRASIRQSFVANTTLQTAYGLDPTLTFEQQFSRVSIEAALIDVFALCSYALEAIFDQHKKDITAIIEARNPHQLGWYKQKALDFRLGQALIADTDRYSDAGLTAASIATSKVVQYAAAVEVADDGSGIPVLRIKTAGSSGGNLAALPSGTITALQSYFADIKDAGVKLLVSSGDPDRLSSRMTIAYDPLQLDSAGKLIGTTIEPAREAAKAYARNLEFNGQLSEMAFVDAVQKATGVKLVYLDNFTSAFGTNPLEDVGIQRIPDAGYAEFADLDLVITYQPYKP